MSEILFYSLICLLGVFISAVSQVLLKKAAMEEHSSVVAEYLNWRVILAYGIFLLATLMNVLAYRGIPLSLGPVLETTSYLYVTFFGVTIFHETLSRRKLGCLALIIFGILIYAAGC